MKRPFAAIFLVIFVVTAEGGSFRNTLSFGVAIAVGGDSIAAGKDREDMNPGLNACIELVAPLDKHFGLGVHLDYTWLTVKKPEGIDHYHAGVHMWDLALVPRFFAPLADDVRMYFEFDPALYLVYDYLNIKEFADSDFKPHFGFT